MTRASIFLGCLTLLASCSREAERVTVVANPTSYIFASGRAEVEIAMERCFGEFRYKSFALCSKRSGRTPLDTMTIFNQSGNLDDFYLESQPGVPVGKSRQYLLEGDSVDYFASFHLHLTDVGNDSTRVEVFTIHPRVLVGESFLPKPPHFVRTLEYMDVAPSTIEEFELLLQLGRCIGAKGMPELKSGR